MKKISSTALVLGLVVFASACTKKEHFEISNVSINPGASVEMKGEKIPLSKPIAPLAVGKVFPEVTVVNASMQNEQLRFGDGKVRVINVVPSIDTAVCEEQSHTLADAKNLNAAVERISVSMDLPFAQKRFQKEGKLENVVFFSDYRTQDFGKKLGLLMGGSGLLARSVMVIDQDGIVRHLQITPSVAQLPDMQKAFEVANQLATKK